MPGLFGAMGVPVETQTRLAAAFSRSWADAEVKRGDGWILGAHAHGARSALRDDGNRCVAIDGEWSLYRELSAGARLFELDDRVLRPATPSVGNLARIDPAANVAHLATDASGTFPLYYAEYQGGLLFSSLLKPLAMTIGARPNELAILEFLRQAFTVGTKTLYSGVHRLLAGQALRFGADRAIRIYELSTVWSDVEPVDDGDAADVAWSGLTRALTRSIPDRGTSLMMSGGWDSRTLLAGCVAVDRTVSGYSHGDVQSRELRIVGELCRSTNVPIRLEPIDERVLDLDMLRAGFGRTENVVFPHWHRAGVVQAADGIACVTAGVFGEILGGHYGPSMIARNGSKILAIGSLLAGVRNPKPLRNIVPRDFLSVPGFGRHWYLDREFESAIDTPRERMNADIETALARLEMRGVRSPVAAIEAFISEHRGAQYINAQLLSCRARTDIAVPFAGGEILPFSARLGLADKIHNNVNRAMLRQNGRPLLQSPMAATLVPASWPLVLQESSRLTRKLYEEVRLVLHDRNPRRFPPPRLGWVEFGFLREGPALRDLANSLESRIWDRGAIDRLVASILQNTANPSLHPLYDQLSKVHTVDLMLRPDR